MNLLDYSKEIVSVLVPIITGITNKFLRGKTKFILAQRHNFTFYLREQRDSDGVVTNPAGTVHTLSHYLRNDGKDTLSGIEAVWNWKPHAINIWPPRPYEEKNDPDGRFSIVIRSLSPGEDLVVEMIAFGSTLPNMVSCRCDQSVARQVELHFFERIPSWKVLVFRASAYLGAATALYLLLRLLQFLLTGS